MSKQGNHRLLKNPLPLTDLVNSRTLFGQIVAQLAGMPPLALGIARTALHAFRDANKAILLKDSLKLQSFG